MLNSQVAFCDRDLVTLWIARIISTSSDRMNVSAFMPVSKEHVDTDQTKVYSIYQYHHTL